MVLGIVVSLVVVACVCYGATLLLDRKFRSKCADLLVALVSNGNPNRNSNTANPMKKTLSLLLFVLLTTLAYSQNMSVSGFRCLENDISARSADVTDINGELCALIRVNTPERGFEFTGCNIEKTEQKNGEIWLFVSPGVKFITIRHRDFGSIINYPFPESIKSGNSYELKLTTARIRPEEQITSQYLIIRSKTPDAKIFIDEEFVDRNQAKKLLSLYEDHTYRVEAPLYHSKEGVVRLNENEKTELQVDLDPAFGYLKISTKPESGAEIEINGKLAKGKTPFTSDKLPSGVYRVQAFKPMYTSEEKEVQLRDGETLEVNIDLIPTFANTEIICQDKDADIYIDEQFKAKGVFKDVLTQGKYRLKVVKPSHRTFSKEIDIVSGNPFVEKVPNLEPIYGKLNIDSNPFDADIYIDGKAYGKTPNQIQKILIGRHTLSLKKEGYKDINETIEIKEGKMLDRKYDLNQITSIKISSTPADARIQIDGRDFGFTPANINTLDAGMHDLKLSKDGYKDVYDKFSITTGINTPLSYTLLSSDRHIMISSNPSNASVYIDGEYRGSTPLTIKEKPGTYKLELKKYDYKKFKKKITVSENTYSDHSFYNFEMKEKFHFKPASKCHFYSSLDVSYIDNEYYYGASLGLVQNAFDNFGVPMLALGLTYMTNGSKHEYLYTFGCFGFRFGIGMRADSDDLEIMMLLGYSITIKRMIFYVDAHGCSDVDMPGVNFGVGFLF